MSEVILLLWVLLACTGSDAGKETAVADSAGADTSGAGSVDEYRAAMARAYCETVYGCDGYGEKVFASVEECVSTWEDLLALDDCTTRCEFDSEAGEECIVDLESYTCEDIESGAGAPESCNRVFNCGSGDPQNCGEGLCPLGE